MKIVPPILITGCPRSGKTLIANILAISGAYFGKVDKMYENTQYDALINTIKTLYEEHGQQMIPQDFRDKVCSIIQKQGYKSGIWAIKHSDIALFWPVFQYAFPDAKVVLVRRDMSDIIYSCMHTSYMTQCNTKEEWRVYLSAYEVGMRDMIMVGGMNCKTIWPNRMTQGDYREVYELLEWLGLPWKSEILSKIDPKFWKQRKNKQLCQQ